MEYVKYYRVQKGDKFSASREMINVTGSNSIELDALKRVHIGDEKHNRNFIKLRMKEKWKNYVSIDTKKSNVNVVVMYFPKFFRDLLKQCAISECIATRKDPKAPPHTVDLEKGEAYSIYGSWNLMMKACNLYAKNSIVTDEKDINSLYSSDEETSKFHSINIQMLKNSLVHASEQAGISEEQINKIIEKAEQINEEIKEQKKGECGR